VFVGYPSSYSAGMSNLGYHYLFSELRSNPFLRVERFFTDTVPRTLESDSRISSAGLLFFSVSYEEDYINMVRMLERSGIPASRKVRGGGPLVIAGGTAPTANPYPLSEIADIIAVGEGEGTLPVISGILSETGGEVSDNLFDRLSELDGIFIPGHSGEGVKYSNPGRLERFPVSFAVSPATAFPDMILIETGRGCPGRCAFCLSGSIYTPLRMIDYGLFKRQLESLKGFPRKVNRVGLVSTSVAANPDFVKITEYLLRSGVTPSFSSFRAQDISEEEAEIIAGTGARSVTLAPESGSENARFRLGKCVVDETYFRAARLLADGGVRRLGLYLLTGYPGEDRTVLKDTENFLKGFREAAQGAVIDIHINIVVPKPWTPLQFYPLPEERELKEMSAALGEVCRRYGRVRVKSLRSAMRQAVISLGDSRVGRAVIEFGSGRVNWQKALRDQGVDPSFIHRERENFPWHRLCGPADEETLRGKYLNITGMV